MPPSGIDNWIKVRGVTLENRVLDLPNTEKMIVPFSSPPLWQNGNYFDPGQPTQVKVPPGRSGRYLARATVHWSPTDNSTFAIPFRDNSYFISRLRKNGDTSHDPREARTITAPVVQASIASQTALWETNLSTNNYLELEVCWQAANQNARDAINGLRLEAWLTLRRLGKPA